MNVVGTVVMIGKTQQSGPSFQKRELVVKALEQYPQTILMEFHQANVGLLDFVQPGENVTVGINLRGREWINPQGEAKYFNTIVGWRVAKENNQNQMQNGQYHGQGSAVDAYFK